MNKLNIVLTDCNTVNAGDLDLSILEEFGNVTYYGETMPNQVHERIKDADIIFNTIPSLILNRENLLNIVWGYEYPGDVRTVDVHIRRLREKIEDNPSRPRYIETVWGAGYKFKN